MLTKLKLQTTPETKLPNGKHYQKVHNRHKINNTEKKANNIPSSTNTQQYRTIQYNTIPNKMIFNMDSPAFVTLQDSDVVCGRGGLANKHPGNRMLRRICCENKVLYQSSMNPTHKQCLILSILMAIQQHGGRFVARTKDGRWEVISDKKAKEKTAQLLRESDVPLTASPVVSTKPMIASSLSQRKSVVSTADAATNNSYKGCHQTQSAATTTTASPPVAQPIIIPPEPLPVNTQNMCEPDAVPSDDFANFLMHALPQPEQQHQALPTTPAPPAAPLVPMVSTATVAVAPPRAFDDGDLFDLIPLEAAGTYAETNPEFQDMCHGLVTALSAC